MTSISMDIKTLLKQTLDFRASDLHLLNDVYPMLRIDGKLKPVPGTKILTKEDLEVLITSMMTKNQIEIFTENRELDFSLSLSKLARFRVNAYIQRGTMAAALRLIPGNIKSIEELGLAKICYNIADLTSGLVLVTGPTGHGKSSTLAAIIEEINATRYEHIVTIEDPIEYTYENKKSIISQREIGHDTFSWKAALKSVLREDPDVVLVGEMRDYETIAAALTVAETGHLVFGTLHTNSAAQTIDRVVDVFPSHQQNQIRMQLANTLEAVLAQRLLPCIGGGRVAAMEVLLGTSAVKTNIREGKTHLIDNIIQTSKESGMSSLESNLVELVKDGRIDMETARKWSLRPEEINRLLGNKR